MIEQGQGGSIINTSSTASRLAPPMVKAYAVAKAALNHFTRCMAEELAPQGIRVNSILLGTYENAGPNLDLISPGFADWWLRETPPWAVSAWPTSRPARRSTWRRTPAATPPAPSCRSPAASPSVRSRSKVTIRIKAVRPSSARLTIGHLSGRMVLSDNPVRFFNSLPNVIRAGEGEGDSPTVGCPTPAPAPCD